MANVTINDSGFDIEKESKIFELVQRKSKAYAASNLTPKDFQGNVSNCIIAIEMSIRMNMDPMMVMQNMYIVHGKPSWSSMFIIACINSCGRFTPLIFKYSGEGDDYQCIAVSTDKKSGQKLESVPVNIGMAKSEGWFSKNGSKWKTMPNIMLQYRAASFFGRAYAPEVLLGLKSNDEIIDIEGGKFEKNNRKINIINNDSREDATERKTIEIKYLRSDIIDKCKESEINTTDFAGFMDFKSFQTVEEWQNVVDNFDMYKTDYIKAIVTDEE